MVYDNLKIIGYYYLYELCTVGSGKSCRGADMITKKRGRGGHYKRTKYQVQRLESMDTVGSCAVCENIDEGSHRRKVRETGWQPSWKARE